MEKDKWYWERLVKRFWSKVDIKGEDDCWNWKGCISDGYGMTYDGYKSIKAYAMAWKLTHGNIPKLINGRKTLIRHVCNNRLCVNPKHLDLGTYTDNANDIHRDGKLVSLNISDIKKVIELRSNGLTYSIIGRILNVSPCVIRKVVKRKGIYGELRNMIDAKIV